VAHPGTMSRAIAAAAAIATLAAGLVATAAPATATVSSPATGVRTPGAIAPVVLGPAPATPTVVGPVAPNGALHASAGGGATFVVNYDAGFNANPAAKAAFQFAVDQWAQAVSSPVPIVIDASFGDLGSPNILGGAGPTWSHANFPGAPVANTWYPVALANALSGTDIDPTDSDITATFSSTFPSFYFGTDGNTGGKIDFASVVMHELGHGLGFLGAMNPSTGSGSCCIGKWPMIYDRFTTSNGTGLLSITDQTALTTALQGQTLRFTGANATAANGGISPQLYAPASWQSGSSYSHLDEATFGAGNANALMTPAIGPNEVIHAPGAIALGIFADTGWTVGNPPVVSVGGTRLVEGNTGTREMRFSLTLSKPSTHTTSVKFATVAATAAAGTDFVAKTGVANIPAGSRSRTISVTVNSDRTVEPDERFKLVISSPVGLNMGTNVGVGWIENDDASSGLQLSVGDASIREGDQGDRLVSIPITQSIVRTAATTVHWASAAGTAAAGSDYENASGTATFPVGATTAYVTFVVHGDTTVEGSESFTVTLTSPSSGSIRRAVGTVRIADDD
jgi:hypothetical protein